MPREPRVNGSIRIGSVLGITIRLHWLLLVMVAVLLVLGGKQGLGFELGLVGLLFGIVLLHELGHSLVARRFGLRVVDITLWPLGGMARMSSIPESTRIEGLIAIAGPAVNFLLAGLGLLLAIATRVLERGSGGDEIVAGTSARLFEGFVVLNLMMGAFNLLPAFPMDGGRLLRAWLGRKGNWLRATETAVRVGRWLAFALALLGLTGVPPLFEPNLGLPLVALFVWWSGMQELAAVRARHARAPLGELFELLRRRTQAQQPAPTSAPAPAAGDEARAGFDAHSIEDLERFRGPLSSWKPRDPEA